MRFRQSAKAAVKRRSPGSEGRNRTVPVIIQSDPGDFGQAVILGQGSVPAGTPNYLIAFVADHGAQPGQDTSDCFYF